MLKKAILRTIAYSDIFTFSLKKEEIWEFLINSKKESKKIFLENLKKLVKKGPLVNKRGFYCFKEKEDLINLRIKKETDNKTKLKIAKKVSFFLSLIPTIKLIGLSGALAAGNAKEDDDIDFFIISKEKTIWLTRLLSIFILSVLRKRRKRNDKKVKNKICLNMLIDERFLELEKKDLYTAHEVVQMKPLFQKDNTYNKFISANFWVKKFLPNSIHRTKQNFTQNKSKTRFNFCFFMFFSVSELLAKKIQILHMRKNVTIEVISDRILAFHPIDHDRIVLKEYEKRLKKYKI